MSDVFVKCINCKNHTVLQGQDWCNGMRNPPYRLDKEDVTLDAPCTYYKPKEGDAK